MDNYKTIAIDLDGTLIDSVHDIAHCLDAIMQSLGRPARGVDAIRHYVGNGIERSIKRALTGEMWAEPAVAEFEQALSLFVDTFADYNGQHSYCFPGVVEALEQMRAQDLKLACVTNKKRQFTGPLLDKLGVLSFFDTLVCGDDLPVNKPDPLPLLHAIEQLGGSPATSLMVGDSVTDVKTAKAAGVKVVAVSYGYNHGQDIRLTEPDWVVDSMAQICTILTQAA